MSTRKCHPEVAEKLVSAWVSLSTNYTKKLREGLAGGLLERRIALQPNSSQVLSLPDTKAWNSIKLISLRTV